VTGALRAHATSGQDLGDGVWPVLAALLPRTAALEVTGSCPPVCLPTQFVFARLVRHAGRLRRPATDAMCRGAVLYAASWQVSSDGRLALVSGLRPRGTSTMALSGGRGLGPEGARRLACLLREAPPPLLSSLNLRQRLHARTSRRLHRLCHSFPAIPLSFFH
jgi:hypothetical protein